MVKIEHKIGGFPMRGYSLFDRGAFFMLYECKASGETVNRPIAIPKDQGDALKLVELILKHTHGELAAQAIIACAGLRNN